MKTKFTPGPWCVEDPMGPEILSIIASGDQPTYKWLHVAQVSVQPEPEDADDIPAREAEANARLIAAAPDLLEALNALTTDLSQSDTVMNTVNLGIFERALAAIAKATGGEA